MVVQVLLYHRISELNEDTTLCVSPSDFAQQMEYLARQGYKTISPQELLEHVRNGLELPGKPILLTFDDGYEDFYKNAFPVLLKHNFKATVFVVANLVGNINLWDTKGGWSEIKLLNWDQVKEVSRQGITIGSHGLSHFPLTKIRSLKKLIKEIRDSKRNIEEKIDLPVNAFSYPYGRSSKFVRWLVKLAGYEMAFSTIKGVNRKNADPFCLKRIEINRHSSRLENFIKTLKSSAPKLNILQVVSCGSWGGQEMQAMSLAKKLKEKGHNIIVASRRSSPVTLNAKESGMQTVSLRVRGSLDLWAILKLVRVICKYNIDIVHGHPSRDYWACVLAVKLTGRKVFVTRHLLTPLHYPTSVMLNLADKIIAVSSATSQVLTKDNLLKKDKVCVVYNGIDLKQYNPDIDPNRIRRELNMDHEGPLIGCIGRMGCKGQKEILYALKNIVSEFPKIRCLFVSEFAEPEELYEDLNKLGLREHVIFKGFRNDVPHIISSVDVLINVPTWEAFGMILIEAMACAKPVIASNIGGIPEIVKDKVNGILVTAGNIEELSKAITNILKDRKEALEIGRRGRELVEKEFNLEDMIKKVEELYFKVL